jgi:hypothetical protein
MHTQSASSSQLSIKVRLSEIFSAKPNGFVWRGMSLGSFGNPRRKLSRPRLGSFGASRIGFVWRVANWLRSAQGHSLPRRIVGRSREVASFGAVPPIAMFCFPELPRSHHAAVRHPEPMKMMAQAGLQSRALHDRSSTYAIEDASFSEQQQPPSSVQNRTHGIFRAPAARQSLPRVLS